ncbi:MAG: 30S ribosomal protein S2 [Lentisphaeria bacterium]|nr:30S ribosomal protein S2 [Lentisphaeria bacterium]MDY0176400.1 30S ribosomal protein S2 [Lentisphaeria bacterium]
MAKTTITDLLEAGVHFGHQTRRWNPKMKPYVYGTRSGITIFDLGKTMHLLAAACEFLSQTAADGGQILFVGAKRQAQECLKSTAERLGMPFMCERWLGGTLTNKDVVFKRLGYLRRLQEQDANGELDRLPKKEVAGLRREMEKLQGTLGGIMNMRGLPKALVVIDVDREHIAVKEAAKLGIPIVALVDSCCNPDAIDYVIPGNDDALRSIKVIVDALATAIASGLGIAHRKESSEAGELSEEAVGKSEPATEQAEEQEEAVEQA